MSAFQLSSISFLAIYCFVRIHIHLNYILFNNSLFEFSHETGGYIMLASAVLVNLALEYWKKDILSQVNSIIIHQSVLPSAFFRHWSVIVYIFFYKIPVKWTFMSVHAAVNSVFFYLSQNMISDLITNRKIRVYFLLK